MQQSVCRLLAVVICTLCMTACSKEIIAHRQAERQANRMLVLLRNSGIYAEKIPDTNSRKLRFNVLVAPGDLSPALALLEKYNLPEQERTGTAESFGAGGMIPTAEQERAKRIVGVEGDIVNALRKIPRVINAEAAVSIPEVDLLRADETERPRPKASVMVVYLPDESEIPPISVEEVQRHVQAKLPELISEEVNVLLLPSPKETDELESAQSSGRVERPVLAGDAGATSGICSERETFLGVEVCAGGRQRLLGIFVAMISGMMLMAVAVVLVSFRAVRYRQHLSRLGAQLRGVSSRSVDQA